MTKIEGNQMTWFLMETAVKVGRFIVAVIDRNYAPLTYMSKVQCYEIATVRMKLTDITSNSTVSGIQRQRR